MAHEHNERCEELQDALANARAAQEPPVRDSAIVGFQATRVIDPSDITPNADPDLAHDIRNLEQQLRDMGCEPR